METRIHTLHQGQLKDSEHRIVGECRVFPTIEHWVLRGEGSLVVC